jgi:hypothetical protein
MPWNAKKARLCGGGMQRSITVTRDDRCAGLRLPDLGVGEEAETAWHARGQGWDRPGTARPIRSPVAEDRITVGALPPRLVLVSSPNAAHAV